MGKRYFINETKLRELLRLAYNSGHVSHPTRTDQLLEDLRENFPECFPEEIPDWATHCIDENSVDKREWWEIPK